MDHQLTAIGCETCQREAWDDGSWNKWTDSGSDGKTYHVCHVCLSSPRGYWKDLFSLCQKSGIGTTHLPRGLHSTAPDSQEVCTAHQQQSEDISVAKQYQQFEGPFAHSPLDHGQIRLLSLLPGGNDLFCEIENADLNSVEAQYEALSYCWGDNDQQKHTIWINGGTFEILDNLYAALMQLRKPTSTRKLWIDAICINQIGDQGKAEKSIQIPLMGRIYNQAASVVIWLGPADNNSDEVFGIIAQQNVEAMQTQKFAIDLGKLLCRSWFRRTWIVQEFVLGKILPQILCGSRVISYGKFMATHWILPYLMKDSPNVDVVQVWKTIDSDGNVISSELVKSKLVAVWNNHDEAEKTLGCLMDVRRAVLDDEGMLRPRPLYKILPFIKGFDVTNLKDKIYGVFGVVSPSVHQYVQVDYENSIAKIYTDAMTHMLRQEQEETGAIDLYLQYPLSLSLEISNPGLPSWVPDFSQNSPFLPFSEDITWYWLYHQNSGRGSHIPLLRKQHGRHTVTRDIVDRQLLLVDATRLAVKGLIIDEIDMVIESAMFGCDEDLRDYSEQQIKSSSEAIQSEGQQIKSWLDALDKTKDQTVPEIVIHAYDVSLLFASTLLRRYRINNLYKIDELCRQKLFNVGRDLGPDRWLTFIWRDLLEGYRTIVDMSDEEFDDQFFYFTGGVTPITGETWILNKMGGTARSGNYSELNIAMTELFKPPKSFFTTAMSGFYGIGPPGVQEGDKLVLLFPEVYMAFIIRPFGDSYQMLGPCIVPPRLRDKFLEDLHSSTYKLEELVIV
jgi:hypothetical protein